MSGHRLDPLLKPRSLAVLGATERREAVGRVMLEQLLHGGYRGRLSAVNPRRDQVLGVACHPSLEDLPEIPEHVAFCIPNAAVEDQLVRAAALGVKAATLVSSLQLPEDRTPPLKERVRAIAREAGMLICGANGNGFYNFDQGLWACGFATRRDHRRGGITLLTHSGSLFGALLDCEERLDYNLAVSTGQELTISLADYMDFALEQPTTRVIGLFLESVRDPAGFVAALGKANRNRVPVVALKVGRSARAAAMATGHSGALVGDDRVYEALFARYGVARVETIDELAAALLLFSMPPPGPGGLATLHDSGGERELLVDLAVREEVAFARLSAGTEAALGALLEAGLAPENPLDAWGSGQDYEAHFGACLSVLMADPAVAFGAIVCDRGPGGLIYPAYPAIAEAARRASGKPVAVVSNHQGSGGSEAAVLAARRGVPVWDGLTAFLRALRCRFAYRDFLSRGPATDRALPEEIARVWRAQLAGRAMVGESESLDLLGAWGLPVNLGMRADSRERVLAAAEVLGFPLVLKSARFGLAHKSDLGGVHLDLADRAALEQAYDALSARLGPEVLVAPMVRGGVELMLGMKSDPDFGAVVVVGAGGLLAELLDDVATAIPPFGAAEARRLLDRLRLRPLLDGLRGRPPADLEALVRAIARFSEIAVALAPVVEEIDVNPLLALPDRAVALDALIVPRQEVDQPLGASAAKRPVDLLTGVSS